MTDSSPLKILSTGAPPEGQVDFGQLVPLVHVHIPKCAGTTLDHIMIGVARGAGRPGVRLRGPIYRQGLGERGLPDAWIAAKGFQYPKDWLFVSGHIPFGCFPPYRGTANEVTLIRDPLARLISHYRMGLQRQYWGPETPIEDLFKQGLLVADAMVRQLSGEITGDKPLDAANIDLALKNFASMRYKGRVEDFDSVIGSILADYNIPFLAYHKFQMGRQIDESETARLSAVLNPYVEIDRVFFDRASANCISNSQVREASLNEIPPSAPILLVSPHLSSEAGEGLTSTFVSVETLAQLAVP